MLIPAATVLAYTLQKLIFAGTYFCRFIFSGISQKKREFIFADLVLKNILWEIIFADSGVFRLFAINPRKPQKTNSLKVDR